MTKLKLWQNSNSNKTQIVTKLTLCQNSNCDKTQIVTKNQKLKCYKVLIVTVVAVMTVVTRKTSFTKKILNSLQYFLYNFFYNNKLSQKNLTQIVMKLNISNCDITQKLKLGWNSKTQIVIKPKNSMLVKLEKTQIVTNKKKLMW